jgi:sugar transferase (PEP-CTERM system associated)
MRELRIFGHYLSIPLVVLSVVDAVAVDVLLLALPVTGRQQLLALAAVGAGAALFANGAVGLYHIQLRSGFVGILARAGVASLLGLPVVALAAWALSLGWRETLFALAVSAMAYGLLGLLHAVFFRAADAGWLRRRVLVFGDQELAGLSRLRRRCDRRGFEVVGYMQPAAGAGGVGMPSLSAEAHRLGAHEIVVALRERRGAEPISELLECRLNGLTVVELGAFVERETGKLRIDCLRPARLAFEANSVGRFQTSVKRVVDLVGALVLLMITLPVTVATIIAIKREEGWRAPVFYRQERVGRGGVTFQLIKFRSMRTDAEADGKPRWASRDDARVTRVGSVIRKLRIDELPQLLNVLRGEMSLVGPRPERPVFVAELEAHIPYYSVRHRIKPGVTGWAQLLYPYGASRADAAEKLQYDLYYLKNRSVVLDLLILLQTVEVVLFRKGAR